MSEGAEIVKQLQAIQFQLLGVLIILFLILVLQK